jgi:hypothetical protein
VSKGVPIRAYVNIVALCMAIGFAVVIVILDHKNGEATSVAFKAAEAKGIQHNGLIERMREMSQTYITRGNVYSALIAAGVVSGIYFGFAHGSHQ